MYLSEDILSSYVCGLRLDPQPWKEGEGKKERGWGQMDVKTIRPTHASLASV